jgi:hypothetical protein
MFRKMAKRNISRQCWEGQVNVSLKLKKAFLVFLKPGAPGFFSWSSKPFRDECKILCLLMCIFLEKGFLGLQWIIARVVNQKGF